jgi:RimJ/RimL family protein N-acetyltransferase
MEIRTARLVIRPLQRADVEAIAIWQPFTDPLLTGYNSPSNESDKERDLWFAMRTGDPARREFAIAEASGGLVGRIGLREIDARGCARLGISIGAEFVNRGYGTEALAGFMDWYFGEGGFARMVLDVAAANLRAVHVYEKLGFRYVLRRYEPMGEEVAAAILDNPLYADIWQYFKRENDQTWALFYDMELTREAWQEKNSFSQRKQSSRDGVRDG